MGVRARVRADLVDGRVGKDERGHSGRASGPGPRPRAPAQGEGGGPGEGRIVESFWHSGDNGIHNVVLVHPFPWSSQRDCDARGYDRVGARFYDNACKCRIRANI